MVLATQSGFVPNDTMKPVPGFNIITLLRNKPFSGEIGIEIEVEGNKFPKHAYDGYDAVDSHLIPSPWKYHRDGSLRGEDNAEYVTSKPLKFKDVPTAVSELWQMFDEYGSILDESNRTSVHVHLNMQNFHLNRLASFSALYFSIEEILTAWCGEHRVGNLFCLRAKDAPAIVTKIKEFIASDGKAHLPDGLHYAGLNASALCKFGSMEIRSLRGCRDPDTIIDWVSVLQRIYELSEEFPDPRKICDNFSGHGPMEYLYFVLGDKMQMVKDGSGLTNQQITDSLYEGIRLAQDLCYCRDWSLYVPTDMEPDPFNRDTAKLAQAMIDQAPSMHGISLTQAMNEFYTTATSDLAALSQGYDDPEAEGAIATPPSQWLVHATDAYDVSVNPDNFWSEPMSNLDWISEHVHDISNDDVDTY